MKQEHSKIKELMKIVPDEEKVAIDAIPLAVMSTLTHIDSETISQTDGARSSRLPILLPDDPYMAVRMVYLTTIKDSESEPFKDSRETEIPQPLPIASSPVPPLDDPYLIPLAARTVPPSSDRTPTSSDSTPVSPLTDEEFEAFEPTDTRITSSHSTALSDTTTPLSLDHPLTQKSPTPTRVSYSHSIARMAIRTQPTLSLGMSDRIAEAAALSPSSFYKSLDLDIEGEGSEEEGPSSEEEEVTPKGHQQAVLVVDTATHEPLGLGYGALRHFPTRVALPVDSSPVASPAMVEAESFLAELRAHVELQGGLIHDHTQRLDALPPLLLRSLEQEQERVAVNFGASLRPILALESWARHVNAQRAEMWQARYDDHSILLTRRGLDHIQTPDQDLVKQNLRKDYQTVETVEKPTISIDHDPSLLGKLKMSNFKN
ncbi:hypothetical protein Tco_0468688 [Tanacetum coccineum]